MLFSCFSLKEKRNKSSHLLVWHGQYPCMDDRCNDCKTIPSGLWNLTTSNGARPRLQERTAAVWDDTPACSSLHPALRDNCAFISGWKFNALHIHCIVHCVSHSWFSCFYCHTCYLQSCNNKRQFCFHSRQILLEGATHFVALQGSIFVRAITALLSVLAPLIFSVLHFLLPNTRPPLW